MSNHQDLSVVNRGRTYQDGGGPLRRGPVLTLLARLLGIEDEWGRNTFQQKEAEETSTLVYDRYYNRHIRYADMNEDNLILSHRQFFCNILTSAEMRFHPQMCFYLQINVLSAGR